jgi:uncharacterized protein (DUF1919 family)
MRTRIGKQRFSIISNNCWGSTIYRVCSLPYLTPFVGLFVMPDCYLELLMNFKSVVTSRLEFRDHSKYEEVNKFRESFGRFPIGVLANRVEIQFQHYKNEDDAKEKWTRRVARINFDDESLFVKFCDRYADKSHLAAFESIPFRHKVCFVAVPQPELSCCVHVAGYEALGFVPDGLTLWSACEPYFDVANWLHKHDGCPSGIYRAIAEAARVRKNISARRPRIL